MCASCSRQWSAAANRAPTPRSPGYANVPALPPPPSPLPPRISLWHISDPDAVGPNEKSTKSAAQRGSGPHGARSFLSQNHCLPCAARVFSALSVSGLRISASIPQKNRQLPLDFRAGTRAARHFRIPTHGETQHFSPGQGMNSGLLRQKLDRYTKSFSSASYAAAIAASSPVVPAGK